MAKRFNLQAAGRNFASLLFDHPMPTGISDITLLNTQSREMDSLFNLSWLRRERYLDFFKMDKGYIAPILDSIADACTNFKEKEHLSDIFNRPRGFKIEIKGYGSKGPRGVIEQVMKSTRLQEKSFDYIRRLVKYGDLFAEILFYEDAIVGLQSYPSEQMWVNKTLKGYFLGPDIDGRPQAYQQKELREGTVVAGFEPWQIVQWKYHETDIHAYSLKSFLDDIREDWWKLTMEEQALVVARLTRAWPRTVHTLDMTGKGEKEQRKEVQSYVQSMTRRQTRGGNMIKNAHSPDEDIFRTTQYINPDGQKAIPKLDKIEMFDPNLAGLANINDIEYMRSKLFVRAPSELVGILTNNQTDITAQDLAFMNLVEYVCWRFSIGLRQIFDMALYLKGYNEVDYNIISPLAEVSSNWKHADAQYRISLMDQVYEETGTWSRREVLRRQGKTEDEINLIISEVVKEEEELPPLGKQASQMGAGKSQV